MQTADDTELSIRDRARASVSYDPDTGVFVRLRSGAVINDRHPNGYLRVSLGRRQMYLAHRLAWLMVYGHWPRGHIDHINGVKNDNRIANLRECEVWQNRANSQKSTRKGSGIASRLKGVSYKADAKLHWEARIRIHGKQWRLGRFPTEEEAHAAYVAEAARIFGQFARAS